MSSLGWWCKLHYPWRFDELRRFLIRLVSHNGEVGKHRLNELIDEDFGEHHT